MPQRDADIGEAAPIADCTGTTDTCPMASGLVHTCEKRFALGINYAWHNFGSDFGGIAAWSQKSISQSPSTYDTELADMRSNGVSVVRWWVFPDFRSDGVTFDSNGDPSGISATAIADVDKALELAEKNDLYVTLTIFSFDDFRPDHTPQNTTLLIRGMTPMVSDASRRAKLIANVVRPLAQAAAASQHRAHLLGWDIINEPEWAVSPTGSAPGGQDFTPNSELATVSLADMRSLITEARTVLKQETPDALTSAGWAAAKWAWAFPDDMMGLDFDQPHIYAWVDQYWPYTKTPAELGYTKPVVMGEFFLQSMPFSDNGDNATYAQILDSWWSHGYSGAWGWQYIENKQNLSLVHTFQTSKGCPAGF